MPYHSSAEDMYEMMLETPVLIQSDGDVMWVPTHALIKTYCSLDLAWFPFDQQECKLVFGSWSYDQSQVCVKAIIIVINTNQSVSSMDVYFVMHKL